MLQSFAVMIGEKIAHIALTRSQYNDIHSVNISTIANADSERGIL